MTEFSEFGENERRGWADVDIVENYNARFGSLADQAAQALLDLVEAGPGQHLLDLCCGSGGLSEAALRRGARVTGIDFSPHMVDLARRRVSDATIVNGDVQAMPFQDGSFDAVLSNFGIQHTPDHARAFGEVIRVLRPGGAFAMSCWDARSPEGAFGLIIEVLKQHADFSSPPPPQPGLFDFADRDTAQQTLKRHALSLVEHRMVSLEWHLEAPEQFFENFARGTVGVRMLIANQPPAAIERLSAAIAEQVEQRFAADDYRVPVPVAVLSAQKI